MELFNHSPKGYQLMMLFRYIHLVRGR